VRVLRVEAGRRLFEVEATLPDGSPCVLWLRCVEGFAPRVALAADGGLLLEFVPAERN
jgi:hypothetical protein